MRDIENRQDIDHLIKEFYRKLMVDDQIGYFFTDVVELDLETHIPKIADFWETTLFHTAGYKGNPMQVHVQLHDKSPLYKEHFDRWVQVFCDTVDELHQGMTAEQAKQRALSIATMMQIKIANR